MSFEPSQLQICGLDDDRLVLDPLTVAHSAEMVPVLDDPLLHTFIGGEPLSAADLRAQYERQSTGWSMDGTERWLNWVIRRREDRRAVGYVQATVTLNDSDPEADIAWVIGSDFQRLGYAKEAAQLMVDWLRTQGVRTISAHVHPEHLASQAVAMHLGLRPTVHIVDGETRWEDGPRTH